MSDRRNFEWGRAYVRRRGRWVRLSRVGSWWNRTWMRITLPFRRNVHVVSRIDVKSGSITVVPRVRRWWQVLR